MKKEQAKKYFDFLIGKLELENINLEEENKLIANKNSRLSAKQRAIVQYCLALKGMINEDSESGK